MPSDDERRINRIGGPCPVCGDEYNLALGPSSSITSPDRGEWCFTQGTLYIHETFYYDEEADHDE